MLYNHPPVAGAVYWYRSLEKKLNKSILLFEKVKEFENSEQKDIAFSHYKSLKQRMQSYENNKLKEWIQISSETINKFMNSKLLKVVNVNSENCNSHIISIRIY